MRNLLMLLVTAVLAPGAIAQISNGSFEPDQPMSNYVLLPGGHLG